MGKRATRLKSPEGSDTVETPADLTAETAVSSMTDPPSDTVVIASVRFGLSQMRSQNGHHQFEIMCQHLARHTICPNILPATGPVAGGGDQGRDFETFHTYLQDPAIGVSAFLGRASGGPLAFACTLQLESLPTKIKSDVNEILDSGVPPHAVHIFLGEDLPVSKRHDLQRWARTTHDIHLEIHDGQAIALALCDPAHFWIAEQFLSISRSLRPVRAPEQIGSWYAELLTRWSTDYQFLATPGNFYELSSAIRHATYTADVQSDVPFWLSKLEALLADSECPELLAHRARYEIAVAALRGLGTLHGRESEVRVYFAKALSITSASDIEDAVVLLTFCRGAFYHDASALSVEDLDRYRTQLLAHIDSLLAGGSSTASRCALLETRGFAAMVLHARVNDSEPPALGRAMPYWQPLLESVSEAPMFPLERLADRLTQMLTNCTDAADHGDFKHDLDQALATRYGGFISAEKCRDRAIALYERGEVIAAIDEVHAAKIGWFAEETLRGAVLAMLLLAHWYRELGLLFASKQYALAAAYICADCDKAELKRYLPTALLAAAESDYAQGHWCDFIDRIAGAQVTHHVVPSQSVDLDRLEEEMQRILFHGAVVAGLVKRLAPHLKADIMEALSCWGMDEELGLAAPIFDEAWKSESPETIWTGLEQELSGPPFGDVGSRRVTS